MRSRRDVSENDPLEIATGDTVEVKKYVIPVVGQILKNRERPRDVGAALTKENGFLNAFHTGQNKNER
jgi:hypothetical protein